MSENIEKRLMSAITALFIAYDKEIRKDAIKVWMKGLLPFGVVACEVVEKAVYANEQFMPRVGQIRAEVEKRVGLQGDPDVLWPETFELMRRWNAGVIEYATHTSKPPFPDLHPAAMFAVESIGAERFDISRESSQIQWLRKEFDRAVASFNELPESERRLAIENKARNTKKKSIEAPKDNGMKRIDVGMTPLEVFRNITEQLYGEGA